MMDFHSTDVFSMKKGDNSSNFIADGIIMAGHIITHSLETKTNTG
jgi:hypothetical protein